jgi:dolichyl-phosphate-mannose--protein O-mannosyl transferase
MPTIANAAGREASETLVAKSARVSLDTGRSEAGTSNTISGQAISDVAGSVLTALLFAMSAWLGSFVTLFPVPDNAIVAFRDRTCPSAWRLTCAAKVVLSSR